MKTAYQIAITIIEEIKQDETLMECKSFSELHDHCDANCLGCQEEEYNEVFRMNEEHEPFHDFEERMEQLNEAQNIVDFWLRAKDKPYFNLELAERLSHLNPIEIATEMADLTEAIHDFKTRLNGLLEVAKAAIHGIDNGHIEKEAAFVILEDTYKGLK